MFNHLLQLTNVFCRALCWWDSIAFDSICSATTTSPTRMATNISIYKDTGNEDTVGMLQNTISTGDEFKTLYTAIYIMRPIVQLLCSRC